MITVADIPDLQAPHVTMAGIAAITKHYFADTVPDRHTALFAYRTISDLIALTDQLFAYNASAMCRVASAVDLDRETKGKLNELLQSIVTSRLQLRDVVRVLDDAIDKRWPGKPGGACRADESPAA